MKLNTELGNKQRACDHSEAFQKERHVYRAHNGARVGNHRSAVDYECYRHEEKDNQPSAEPWPVVDEDKNGSDEFYDRRYDYPKGASGNCRRHQVDVGTHVGEVSDSRQKKDQREENPGGYTDHGTGQNEIIDFHSA